MSTKESRLILKCIKKQNWDKMKEVYKGKWEEIDKALGSLIGAGIGDSTGSRLEFLGHKPKEEEVKEALLMPGGGIWGVSSGQLTDDTEMALSLAHALVNPINTSNSKFNINSIAYYYSFWFKSKPFDIGNTTKKAISFISNLNPTDPNLANLMIQNSLKVNIKSKANGSLMRATPLAIWGYKLPVLQLAECAKRESQLTHPNPTCCDAVASYVIACSHLITNQEDNKGAFNKAYNWVKNQGNKEVIEWLDLAKQDINIPFYPEQGFIKIAFIHAFRHLFLGTDFLQALKCILEGGGDTDTNAAIVCGLLGAFHGISRLPHHMVSTLLNCNFQNGVIRPLEFLPSLIPYYVRVLLEKAPDDLEKKEKEKEKIQNLNQNLNQIQNLNQENNLYVNLEILDKIQHKEL
ncbi:leucine rich repeat family protein [Anaeramoeba ignava]|uniref:Leucine rich repeat family protein n=1 Tax=Anaeramoeba ignava TaxID=1746090 RepID=A0A9Q0LNA1_ANAIG|nr:leucine rich repeat family protein [Anaeramoeba ignava]